MTPLTALAAAMEAERGKYQRAYLRADRDEYNEPIGNCRKCAILIDGLKGAGFVLMVCCATYGGADILYRLLNLLSNLHGCKP